MAEIIGITNVYCRDAQGASDLPDISGQLIKPHTFSQNPLD